MGAFFDILNEYSLDTITLEYDPKRRLFVALGSLNDFTTNTGLNRGLTAAIDVMLRSDIENPFLPAVPSLHEVEHWLKTRQGEKYIITRTARFEEGTRVSSEYREGTAIIYEMDSQPEDYGRFVRDDLL